MTSSTSAHVAPRSRFTPVTPTSRFNPKYDEKSSFNPQLNLQSRFNPVGKPDCNELQEFFDAKD
jgi:hypothetical protein